MWYRKAQTVDSSQDYIRSEIKKLYSANPQWPKIADSYCSPQHDQWLECATRAYLYAVKKYGGWEAFRKEYEKQLYQLYKEISSKHYPNTEQLVPGAYYILPEGEIFPVAYRHEEIDQVILGRMRVPPYISLSDSGFGMNMGRTIYLRKYPNGTKSILIFFQPTINQMNTIEDLGGPYTLVPSPDDPEEPVIHSPNLSQALLDMDVLPRYDPQKRFNPHYKTQHVFEEYPELEGK